MRHVKWLRGGLTQVPGVKVGHVTDRKGATGVTAVLFDHACPGGVDVTGGAAGTRQFAALDPLHVVGHVHAVVFAGGSAHGLDAGTGAMRYLERHETGLPVVEGQWVPIVPTAILFDLGLGEPGIRPDAAMGEAACEAATAGPVAEGSVGAGTGATVGKPLGLERAMKGGLGSTAVRLPTGHTLATLVAVNAFGDVVDPATRTPVAGLRTGPRSRRLARSTDVLVGRGALRRYGEPAEGNTVLGLVVTDAPLSRLDLTLVARLTGQGFARTIDPCHTPVDGDLVVAVSTTGPGGAGPDAAVVGLVAAEAMSRAILRGVRLARGLGGVPGLGDR